MTGCQLKKQTNEQQKKSINDKKNSLICQWIYIFIEETTADTGRTCELSTVSRLSKSGFKPIVKKKIVFHSEVQRWNGAQGCHLVLFPTPLCTQCLVQDLEQRMLPFITAEGIYNQICVCRLLRFHCWQLQIARVTSLLQARQWDERSNSGSKRF